MKPLKKKTKRTQVKPIVIQDRKEQHVAITNAEAQEENTLVYDKEVQIEALSSSIIIDETVHEKETQTIRTRYHNKEIQVDLQLKNVMMDNDARIVKLQKDMAQAQQTIEKLIEGTVPQEKYHKFQQQVKNINASEVGAFDRWREVEEKVKKVTNRLDIVMSQMDTLCSMYTDVLACMALAKTMLCFSWIGIYN